MKQFRLVIILISLFVFSSFQLQAQEVSTVIITARNFGSSGIDIEVVKPDYSIGERVFGSKDKKVFFVEVKKVLDLWIKEGYTITHVESHVYPHSSSINYSYILIKTHE